MRFSLENSSPDSKRFTRGAGGKTRRPDVADDHFLGGFHFPFDISAIKFSASFFFGFFFENLVTADKKQIAPKKRRGAKNRGIDINSAVCRVYMVQYFAYLWMTNLWPSLAWPSCGVG